MIGEVAICPMRPARVDRVGHIGRPMSREFSYTHASEAYLPFSLCSPTDKNRTTEAISIGYAQGPFGAVDLDVGQAMGPTSKLVTRVATGPF